MADLISTAQLFMMEDNDEIVDFIAIIAAAEAAFLKEVYEDRKREMDRLKKQRRA